MERSPLISCVVPAYNAERYLDEALASILAQTYRPIEVIVVDDGSTDRTPEIAAGYRSEVRCIRQENAGPAAALNRGIEAAGGSFIGFLAADDLWHREKLSRQMARFETLVGLDVSVTHIQNFWSPEVEAEASQFENHRIAQPMPGYLAVTMLARADVFERVGLFNASLPHGNDIDWFLRAREARIEIDLLPDVLVNRRLHKTNRSRRLATNSRDTILEILKASIDRNREAAGKTSD